jgi:hypothetical protein
MNNRSPSEIMKTFTADNPPTLDVAVIAALETLERTNLPRLDFGDLKRCLFVGSGNGRCTAEILGKRFDCTIADESSLKAELDKTEYHAAVVISASGEKDAPEIVLTLKERGIPVRLLTCRPQSSAAKLAHEVTEFPLGREPLSYNVLTYFSMILASTGEKPGDILKHLENIDGMVLDGDFARHPGFCFIVPPQFSTVLKMLEIKFLELFQLHLAYHGFTGAFAKRHVTSLVQHPQGMYLNLDDQFDPEQLKLACEYVTFPLPAGSSWGMVAAVGYYLTGLIQKENLPWFADQLVAYCRRQGKEPIAE